MLSINIKHATHPLTVSSPTIIVEDVQRSTAQVLEFVGKIIINNATHLNLSFNNEQRMNKSIVVMLDRRRTQMQKLCRMNLK